MYAADRPPPHFHVLMRDGREAQIEIASLTVMEGTVTPRVLQAALAWGAANKQLLASQWDRLNGVLR